jgi:NhaB family Na+:H+ antiporter
MAPVTMPVLFFGLAHLRLLEVTGKFGYGAKLPENVRLVLEEFQAKADAAQQSHQRAPRGAGPGGGHSGCWAWPCTWAEVGLIGLMVIVLLTAFNGVVEEHQIGHAFEEALPFTALLVVFFAIVAVIHDQHLFTPVIDAVLAMDQRSVRPCSSSPTACCR